MSGTVIGCISCLRDAARNLESALGRPIEPVLPDLYHPVCRFQSKKPGQKKAPGKAGQRYWKNVGLGFKTPKEAIEGENLQHGSSAHDKLTMTAKRIEAGTAAGSAITAISC